MWAALGPAGKAGARVFFPFLLVSWCSSWTPSRINHPPPWAPTALGVFFYYCTQSANIYWALCAKQLEMESWDDHPSLCPGAVEVCWENSLPCMTAPHTHVCLLHKEPTQLTKAVSRHSVKLVEWMKLVCRGRLFHGPKSLKAANENLPQRNRKLSTSQNRDTTFPTAVSPVAS